MPPFRMYLVLSIVFFLIAFFDPHEELGILFEAADDFRGITVSFASDGEPNEDCNIEELEMSEWPVWLSSRLTEERLKLACDRIIEDDGRIFGQKLLYNVPAALFILLPLMALVLKVLYPLSKRYYVEHLLFVVH